MKYEFFYSAKARSDLDDLSLKDSQRVISKLDFYITQADPLKFAKALQGDLKGLFRFRVGDYRVLFKKDAQGQIIILHILTVKHRKEVYE